MQRKLVQQGPATLMISIPAKWAKERGLKKGAIVDVRESGNELIIAPETKAQISREIIDLRKYKLLSKRTFVAAYLRGADEIVVKYDTPEKARAIQERVRDLIGMEVVEQSKDFLIVKNMGSAEDILEPLRRRVFFMVDSMGNEVHESLLSKNQTRQTDKNSHGYILDMEQNINRFTDHCFRLLLKQGANDHRETPVIYMLVSFLEQLADEYKTFTTSNVDKPGISQFTRILHMYKRIQSNYFEFSPEKAMEIANERDLLFAILTKSKSENNSREALLRMLHILANMLGETLILSKTKPEHPNDR